MKASELFVKCLENEGVEYIFGVPGEENLDVMEALADSDQIWSIVLPLLFEPDPD
jgi:acetolactate synthase-1/2/3 large subunit